MPRCVSSGAIWSSRVRAAFCARSTAVTWKRMRCRRSGNPSAARPGGGEGSSALDELRRRFDYRYQQKPAAGGSQAGARFGGGSSAGVKSEAQRPVVVQPTRSTAGMRSVGVRQGESSLVEGAAPVSCGDYAVGDRVSHLKFGAGGHPPHRNPGVGSQAGGRIFRIRGENPAGQIRQTDQIIGNPPEGFRLKTGRQ